MLYSNNSNFQSENDIGRSPINYKKNLLTPIDSPTNGAKKTFSNKILSFAAHHVYQHLERVVIDIAAHIFLINFFFQN